MISGDQIKLSLHRFRIARFADLAFMSARAIMQACRPVSAPGFSDVGFMGETFPGRVVVLVSCVNPLPLHCTSLRVRCLCPQDTTTESPRADNFWPETDNARG